MRFILFFLRCLASLASGLGKKKKLFILIYHRVLDAPDYLRPGEVDINSFDWQMDLLSKHFNVLSLEEGVNRLNTHTLPDRAVCITFDDGYQDNYKNALPILKKHTLKSIFFIASNFLNDGRMWNDSVIESIRKLNCASLNLTKFGLGTFDLTTDQDKVSSVKQIITKIKYLPLNEREKIANHIAKLAADLPNDLMMTEDQVKELRAQGMDIGGHTKSHPILATLEPEQVIDEIADNKTFLESLLGEKIIFFAYPNGKPEIDYLKNQTEYVKQAGYQAAVSTEWGVADQKWDLFQLPRFTPWDTSPVKFMMRMVYMFFRA